MLDNLIIFLEGYLGSNLFANMVFVIKVVFYSSFIWIPIVFFISIIKIWINYIQMSFIQKQGSVLLEIKIPQEVTRSPLAMELVLTQFWQKASNTYLETYYEGKVRPWFSLEIVSLGGEIHFYIWTWKKFKGIVEAQMYAHYPNVEVHEVDDYAIPLIHDPENFPLWGAEWALTKPDPYPIKTYVDYGLDKDTEDEFKIDPIATILEYMASLKQGEQSWIQILIQAHKKLDIKSGSLRKKPDWTDGAKKEIEKIKKEGSISADADEKNQRVFLTEGQKETISAIERSISKLPFECMIRTFYIGTKESFSTSNIPGLVGTTRQYSSPNLNGFRLSWFTDFDNPWEDFRRIRRNKRERQLIDAYKLRSFFNPPYKFFKQKPFILTTEEIATIFHLPGRNVTTPTLGRITSKKGEAPANLPI